ncbi:MAG: hypothetical protein OIF57_09240 [Marinobacterium sp.]|nr:hypothetical protein [Marinobacterium sp.]
MTTEYKPLFNRTYLKILAAGSALAIFWLSSMDQQNMADQGRVGNSAVYWMQNSNPDPEYGLLPRLQVILPTESAFSSAELNRQQWRGSILRERLQQQLGQQYGFKLQVADDYISFSIAENTDSDTPLPAIAPLMAALAQPVDVSQWQAQLEQVEARQYLAQKEDAVRLLAKLADRLGPTQRQPLNWSQLFIQPRYILAADNAQQRAETLASSLPDNDSNRSLPARTLALHGQHQAELSSQQPLLLLAATFPARNDRDFVRQRLIVTTSELALNRYPVASGSQFRMRWKTLQQGGYQAVVFSSEQPLNEGQLTALRNRIDTELVDEARQQLLARWQNVDQTPRWQLNTLNLIARYQLPLDALQGYRRLLGELGSETIAQATRQLFDPEQQFTLRVE